MATIIRPTETLVNATLAPALEYLLSQVVCLVRIETGIEVSEYVKTMVSVAEEL